MKPKCGCSLVLIIVLIGSLLFSAFLNFGGFGPMLRVGLAVAMKIMPLGEELKVWIEQPIPVGAIVKLNSAESVAPEGANSGMGQVTFNMTMAKWDNEVEPTEEKPERLTTLVLIQEEAEVDQIQRYKVVLTRVALNYWNFVNWIIVIIAFAGLNTGVVLKVLDMKSDAPEK